ncbi:GDSL-type esterase/lipase family protein [Arachidicoccus soli]|uniref:Sialate O-acetylesterase n=1 Tax=Arachidicoccus soli TaxID=2341117 RepID=A0A386HRG3_9BACT|nr:GDSL-type esterase/lipase family protein [Arachidicoccus soli]AYD48373.1 sialate O-acetylesterase [Arachidicoccus soli]
MKKVALLFLIFLFSQNIFAQKQKIKIACIGNSVTYGYTLPNPSTQSYPALLQKKLGNNFIVGNFGHSGATLLRQGHNPYYKTKEFSEALQMRPDIAIIHLGLNDTDPRDFPNFRDEFIPDYNRLIDTLRKINPKMKIYICKMTPIFTGHPRFMSSTFDWYWNLQERIEQIAKINQTGLIDLYEALHNRPDLFTDAPTLHPNVQGAAKLCDVIYKGITGDFGGLKMPDIFTDNMVLQRNKPIIVWGVANAGTTVEVTFHHQEKETIVTANGKWKITFPKMNATTKPDSLSIENEGKKLVFQNILVGDVWLCSGQSNMYFSLAESKGGDSIADRAIEKEHIRLYKYKPFAETDNVAWDSAALTKADNLDFFSGQWKLNKENAAKEFSAVGYIFGKKIQQEENVPVGLIEVAVGGSPLISWLDRLTLESNPLFEPALHNWRNSDYLMDWCRARINTNLKNATSPYQRHPYDPCFNFEAGIANIIPFPIKGVVWYQGESDADNPELYKKLFPVFVNDWRQQWKDNFPFYYVQLSSIERPSWNYFRNAQRELLSQIPNSGMAVTSDLGDKMNVHYTNKTPVGMRLADLALHYTYNSMKIIPNGPLVKSVVEKNNQIEISFSQSEGLTTSDKKEVRGFQLLNDKGYFMPAKAIINDNKIFIIIPKNEKIEKVVYGWKPFTRANLVNSADLPASTFMMKVK